MADQTHPDPENTAPSFTPILTIIFGLFIFGSSIITTLIMGNNWIDRDKLLEELQTKNPRIQKIVSIEYHVLRKSVVTVWQTDMIYRQGNLRYSGQVRYRVDSNITFGHSTTEE